jgi:nucleoside-diphosphate-sugar epimerase
MNKETIQIRGGTQTFDKLDVRDAARALFFLLNTPSRQWKPTYNVATANPVGIFEIAQKVVDLAELHNGGFRSKILFKEQEVKLHSHLNADLFKLDTGWKPHYNLNQTILSLIYYFKKHPTIVTVKI